MAFSTEELITPLDPVKHAREIARLRSCRTLAHLDQLVTEGWLLPDGKDPRLKLIRHGSGTYMVVEYVDGWSKRLSQHLYERRR